LSGNNISEISFNDIDRIESWHQLRSLNLSDNKLEELPVEISELDELMTPFFRRFQTSVQNLSPKITFGVGQASSQKRPKNMLNILFLLILVGDIGLKTFVGLINS